MVTTNTSNATALKARVSYIESIKENVTVSSWLLWFFSLALISLVFGITLPFAPHLHMDEVIILELGRVILNSSTDWSLNWLESKNQPAWVWFYVGPVMQELSYRFIGEYGPRIFSLIGSLLAATTVVGWLLSRGVARIPAFVLGLVFLLDPIFVQSYTRGRIDGWAIALCIGACWIIRHYSYRISKGYIVIAGILTSLSLFVWPSTILLMPLVFLELFNVVSKNFKQSKNKKESAIILLLFCASSLGTIVLLILPILPQLYSYFYNILEGMAINMRFGAADEKRSILTEAFIPIIELSKSLRFTLVLTVLTIISAFVRKEITLILASLAAFSIMYFTIVYTYRVLYLLPYFIAIVSCIYKVNDKPVTLLTSLLKKSGLVLMLFWVIGLSLITRTALAIEISDSNDKKRLFEIAESVIGFGNYNVYSPPEFYYAGRNLGWKMYNSYRAVGEPLSSDMLKQLLAKADYVIVSDWQVTEEYSKQLKKENMRLIGTYNTYQDPKITSDGKTTNITRLRILYSIYKQPYGSYKIYKKGISG